MAVIKTDTFTEPGAGTHPLEDHNSDVGGGWGSGSDDVTSFDIAETNDTVSADSNGRFGALGDENPSNADHLCSVNGRTEVDAAGNDVGAIVRGVNGTFQGGSSDGYYFHIISVGGGQGFHILGKIDGGTRSEIGSAVEIGSFSESTDYDIRTEAIGTAIKGFLNDSEVQSEIDSALTAAGNIGIYVRNANAVITSLNSEDFVVAGGRNTLRSPKRNYFNHLLTR